MMQERATGDIALRPTGNAQGAYFFIRFTTGWRLNSQLFIPLPLPQDVINGVHCLLHRNPRGLYIQDRDRHPFLEAEDVADDDTDNSTYAPSNKENSKNIDERDNNDDYTNRTF